LSKLIVGKLRYGVLLDLKNNEFSFGLWHNNVSVKFIPFCAIL